jgi:hypothetical protein
MRRRRFRGLVQCPICADHAITRLPSAPRLNLSGAAAAGAANGRRAQGPGAAPVTLQSLYMKAVKQVLAQTEDVGERFAEEARRMHYDEAPERGIRGHGVDEVQALAEGHRYAGSWCRLRSKQTAHCRVLCRGSVPGA